MGINSSDLILVVYVLYSIYIYIFSVLIPQSSYLVPSICFFYLNIILFVNFRSLYISG